MELFTWKDEYALHIGSVDEQHRGLFRAAQSLHDAMRAGQGRDRLGKLLDELISYTKTHFAHEEGLLQTYSYPGFAKHKQEHDDLTKQVMDFRAAFARNDATVTMDVMKFLGDWLSHHIRGSDKDYSVHLKARGLS